MYLNLGFLKAGSGSSSGVTPTLVQRTHGSDGGGSTSRSITLPGTIAVGQLIVLVLSVASGTITTPTGYTHASNNVYYRVALNAAEGGSVIPFTISSSSADSNHLALVFANATRVEAAAVTATTANANPPSLTVTWGAGTNLFMAIYEGLHTGNNLTAYPANCPLYHFAEEAGIDAYMAGAASALATFDPAAFTTDANDHRAITLGLG